MNLLPPSIAQVSTPQAIWYIAHALRHQGFVVQRRYYKASEAGHKNHYRAELVPFLNPQAVQAAGLTVPDIMEWSAAHPGKVFTHPIYGALCLRWGENPHGFAVHELPESPVTEQQVPFTPHTCWRSGITYYQLAMPEDVERTEPVLVARLRDLAGLERHEWEIGQEGDWRGWYATDRLALEQVLVSLGRTLALAQPSWQYGVWVQLEPGDDQRCLVAAYATTEEAWAHFESLPSPDSEHRMAFPRATYGCAVKWPGQSVEWHVMDGMRVPKPYAQYLLENKTSWKGPVMPVASAGSINEAEQGLLGPAPFLTEVLALSNFTRPQQAAELGWSMRELQRRENNPALLTPGHLEQVAHLSGVALGQLTAQLSQVLQAREKARRQQVAYAQGTCLDL
ncbi:hypothetical protein GCM10028822_00340 [Hymenobacter terrigena]